MTWIVCPQNARAFERSDKVCNLERIDPGPSPFEVSFQVGLDLASIFWSMFGVKLEWSSYESILLFCWIGFGPFSCYFGFECKTTNDLKLVQFWVILWINRTNSRIVFSYYFFNIVQIINNKGSYTSLKVLNVLVLL